MDFLQKIYQQDILNKDECLKQINLYLEEKFFSILFLEDLQKKKNFYLNFIKNEIFQNKKEENEEKKRKKNQILNETKQLIFLIYKKKLENFNQNEEKKIENNSFLFLPSNCKLGSYHPITLTMHKIYNIMKNLNFIFFDAPEIDSLENVFDKLNMDIFHPARADQQSFILKNFQEIPRTQCTNFQCHVLKSWNEKDDFKYFHMGSVYRYDSDMTHSPKFHQFETFVGNKSINLCSLLDFIDKFLFAFFEKKIEKRIRTSYFPFTEISYEIDIKWNNKWLEIAGCGLVHPQVFTLNSKPFIKSWAMGMGIERLIMIANENITDVRKLYQNDVRNY